MTSKDGTCNDIFEKKMIPAGSYNKLKPKQYDLFKIMKKINGSAYVGDLLSNLAMSKTFNVADLYDITQPSSYIQIITRGRDLLIQKDKHKKLLNYPLVHVRERSVISSRAQGIILVEDEQ